MTLASSCLDAKWRCRRALCRSPSPQAQGDGTVKPDGPAMAWDVVIPVLESSSAVKVGPTVRPAQARLSGTARLQQYGMRSLWEGMIQSTLLAPDHAALCIIHCIIAS